VQDLHSTLTAASHMLSLHFWHVGTTLAGIEMLLSKRFDTKRLACKETQPAKANGGIFQLS
jgi:hypothetical protein